MRKMTVRTERWPFKKPFKISRLEPFVNAEVVVVEIDEDGFTGRGEAEQSDVFEAHLPSTLAGIEQARAAVERGIDRHGLQNLLSPGCARNALDCALIDLEAKRSGEPAWKLLGLDVPLRPVPTVYSLSLDSPRAMAADAVAHAQWPAIKLKLGATGDMDRVAAVRDALPDAELLVDANTGWDPEMLTHYLPELEQFRVALVEQPLPTDLDATLDGLDHAVPIAADESCLDLSSLPSMSGRFDIVNIKLDKTGGLTEALQLATEARALGMEVMVGCNFCTSLSMAPAMVVAQFAKFVDLDGPLQLSSDRPHGLRYEDGVVHPPEPALWG